MHCKQFIIIIPVMMALVMSISCARVPQENGEEYRQRVTRARARKFQKKNAAVRLGLVARKKQNLQVIRIMQKKLTEHSLRAKVVLTRYPDQLSTMLRSGKVDMIAGDFTEDMVRRWNFTPVVFYNDNQGGQFCCAIRNDDPVLTGIFSAVTPQQKSKYDAATEKPAD